MNKATLINELAKKTGANRQVVEDVINAALDEIIDQLKAGKSVTFAGFGTFSPRERHARMGVNPLNPKEKIQMPATVVPKFKAGKTLKDALKDSTTGQAKLDESPAVTEPTDEEPLM